MTGYDVITTRTYHFDDNGNFSDKGIGTGRTDRWQVRVAERETLIPEIIIYHIHVRSGHATRRLLTSVDVMCSCGKKLPANILNDIYTINKTQHKHCYSAIERPAYHRLDLLKMLADNWYLDENKKQKEPALFQREPALFHVCSLNHPAYLYYGKGIPISQIAMPPWEDKCKTCHQDIPKGIRMALLLLSKKVSLR